MFRRRTLLGEKGAPVKEGCLTFTASEDGTFSFTKDGLSYSTDGYTWTELAANTPTPTIAAGSKIYFKGTMTPSGASPFGIGTFSSTGYFTASGTPMSLLFGDNFGRQTSLSGKVFAFYQLFRDCTKLTSIDDLSLPATTLGTHCYYEMFYGCEGLTSIPSTLLPATTLVYACYAYMFYRCTGLTNVPSTLLPATTLANYCYQGMFDYCTGLTSIPSTLLPATTLATQCYCAMFYACTGLTSIPRGLLPATTLVDYCYMSMFSGCRNITTAPNLTATTLVDSCYYMMFYNCTKLNSIRMLATNISATDCLSNWVQGVASSGTFYKKSGASIPAGINGIPSRWTVVNE